MKGRLVALGMLVIAAALAAGGWGPWLLPRLGDVNHDGRVSQADADIVLAADAGLPTGYCPMNCGDVNLDRVVNSTDALVIMSYAAGQRVRLPIGIWWCPRKVAQPLGCQ